MVEDKDPPKPPPPALVACCHVCGERLAAAPVVICRKCRNPHHRECWRYNRGCAVYGCGSRTFQTPPLDRGEEDTTFAVTQPPSPANFSVAVAVALIVIVYGIFLSVRLTPWFLVPAVLSYIAALTGSVFYQANARTLLTFDRASGTVRRQLVFRGRPLGATLTCWLAASAVAEVHLHRFDWLQFRIQRLYVALTDGTRRLISETRTMSGSPWDSELEDLAERIARFGDTTVRFIEGQEPPSFQEIAEATNQKALGSEAPPPALPPTSDPDGPTG